MGDLSKDFSRSEFACKCGCGFDTVDAELIKILQAERDFLNQRITITSGCRCIEYNEKVQKEANTNYIPYSSKSLHLQGRAADHVAEHNRPIDQHRFLKTLSPGGLGLYKTFVHVDTRSHESVRWDYS